MDLKNINESSQKQVKGYIDINYVENYLEETIFMFEELGNILIDKMKTRNPNETFNDIHDIIIWEKQMMNKLKDLCFIPHEYIRYM